MEHRWGQRLTLNVRVRLTCLPHAIGFGWMTDVSISGAFVRTGLVLPALARVHLALGWHDRNDRLQYPTQPVSAHVVRNAKHGIGIEWGELAPAAIGELLRLVPQYAPVYTQARPALGQRIAL